MIRLIKPICAVLCIFLIAVFGLVLTGRATSGGHTLGRIAEIAAHEKLVTADITTLTLFQTDGCSGGQSARWRRFATHSDWFSKRFGPAPPWESCCLAHDQKYHNAAKSTTADDSFNNRLRADQALRICVAQTGDSGGYPAMANLMYLSVRLGGGPCTGFSWRWGFGLAPC